MHMRFRTAKIAKIARVVVMLAAMSGFGVAAAGQTPQTGQTPQSGQAPAAPGGQALPLTMDQAVAMALESNLGLKAERLNLDLASHSIALARSTFLPSATSTLGRSTSKSVPFDFTQGSSDISSTGVNVSGSVSQRLRWYGGNYSLTWTASRSSQTGGLSSFNPHLSSGLRVNFTQPLLRGFRTDSSRVSLVTSERQREITDIVLQQRIVTTESSVRLAYLSLVGAIEGKKVAEQNMAIAERSLQQSKARVAVGQSPQIEIIQSEAQVKSNEVSLLQAAVQISTAEDSLRSLILDPARPDYWEVRLVPTDTIKLTPREIDATEAIKNALANRLDLASQKRSLEITDINLALSKNTTLPGVDFNVGYTAQGTAGTQLEFGSGFPPPVVGSTTRAFTGALGDTFGAAYPSWTVGVTVSYPLGRTAAEVSYAQAQIRKRQQLIALQETQLEIVRQVRDAVRQVQNSFQRVQASQSFREAAQQQLDAEERRFAVGMSTTLELQIRQRDLANAKVSELSAMIDYNRALIQFDRVQKTQ